MATQNKQTAQDKDLDKVSVIVGGKVHSDWSGYGIDSDFLIPADAWSMRLGLPDGIFPEGVARGVPVQVRIGPDVVMTGRIDRVSRTVSRDQVSLSVTGRDGAAILVDCASPLLTSRQAGLEEVIARSLGRWVSKISSCTPRARSAMTKSPLNLVSGHGISC